MRYLWVCIAMLTAASCTMGQVAQVEPDIYVIVATSPMVYEGPMGDVARAHQQMDQARNRAVRRMNGYCAGQGRRAVLIEETFSVQSRRGGDLETAGWYGVRTLTFQCEARQ